MRTGRKRGGVAGAGDEGYCSQRRHDSLLGRNGSSEVGLNSGEVSCAGSGLRARATHGVRSAVFDFPTRRYSPIADILTTPSSSIRSTAGLAGFLILTHALHRPER